ncbi:MAG: hypothetical protein K2O46_04110 [Bacteroidales bacterium]|nr:hypothetical protein [Bacteroidales bacterium]
MFKHNETKGQVARIRKNAWPLLLVAALCVATPLHALVPPQYTDNDNYIAKGARRVIVKMFEAIDKIDHVEVGAMQEHPVIVEYAENGNLARVMELNQKGDMLFYFTTEEKDGKPSTQKRYSDKDLMDAYGTFDYNAKGKIQSESVYNAEGDLSYTEIYTYDKSGRLGNVTRRNPRGEKLQTMEYAYDAAGHRTMEQMKGKEDRLIYRKNMAYDAQGRLINEEYYNKDGVMKSKTAYTYNDKGDIDYVREGVPGGSVGTMKLVYEYDTHNNWTRCTIYANDCVPTTIVARQIEYR